MATGLTVKLLAIQLKISVDYLICQFADAGINKTDSDYVTPEEKNILFRYVDSNQKQISNSVLNKLTLQRKTCSTLNVSSGGKSKSVHIEIRKKHTYVQCHAHVSHGINKHIKQQKECNEKVDNVSFFSNKVNSLNNDILDQGSGLLLQSNNNIVAFSDDYKYQESSTIMSISEKSDNNDASVERCNLNRQPQISDVPRYDQSKQKISNISLDIPFISPVHISNDATSDAAIVSSTRKQLSNDRRMRVRQRLRTSKSRNHKINIVSAKNRKNSDDRVFDINYDEYNERPSSFTRGIKNRQRRPSVLTHAFKKPVQMITRDVVIGEMITVAELANKMAVKSSQVIKVMIKLGTMATINQVIDQQTAKLVVEEMGHHVILRHENDLESIIMNDRDNSTIIGGVLLDHVEYRAPVVTIMGHVDHGKTSLLDYIRSTKLASLEVGGITQRIGAYCVDLPGKGVITFLDTPGHAAFTAMRIRGIRITDIVVLVVAVDDGVMPQTIEAIQHVKSAGVSMIVALNKIDKVDNNIINFDRIKTELAQHGVVSEEWGGDIQFVSVSAKLGLGIDDLLDAILLQSEILELKAIRDGMATGIVIESFLDKGRGPVAVILVREGTLKCGDVVLCGVEFGRIRAMRNEFGCNVSVAGPSVPVEVFGLSGPPFAGDVMTVVRDERKAREVALYRQSKFRSMKLAEKRKNRLRTSLVDITAEGNTKVVDFYIILKADIQGSVETIIDVLKKFSNDDLKICIVSSGVGTITETDVSLAIATHSVLLGFNVRPDVLARRMIELERVVVYYHSIIYDLIDDIKRLIDSMLIPKHSRENLALAEVRDVFCLHKLGNVAGCMILEGVVRRHNKVRILRKKVVICEGEVESLRRFKNDVNEVRAGMECGIAIKNYIDIHSGDCLEIFEDKNV